MKDNDYRAIRFVVDVKSEAGKFSVTVTYESMVKFMADNGLLQEAYVLKRTGTGS